MCNLSDAFATAGDEDCFTFGGIFKMSVRGYERVDVMLVSLDGLHIGQGR